MDAIQKRRITGDISGIHLLKKTMALACFFSGCLAGGNIDRFIVQLPAWRYINILDWAEYSRHADLGNGVWLYPFEAVGTSVLLMISSTIAATRKNASMRISIIIYMATFFSFLKLVITAFASPLLISLKHREYNREETLRIFNQFHFWSPFNVVVQIVCFVLCIWSVCKLFSVCQKSVE